MCTAGLDNVKHESNATGVWDKFTRLDTVTEATGKEDVINAAKKDTSFAIVSHRKISRRVQRGVSCQGG